MLFFRKNYALVETTFLQQLLYVYFVWILIKNCRFCGRCVAIALCFVSKSSLHISNQTKNYFVCNLDMATVVFNFVSVSLSLMKIISSIKKLQSQLACSKRYGFWIYCVKTMFKVDSWSFWHLLHKNLCNGQSVYTG